MKIFLYIVLILSLFSPIYTYAIYPIILKGIAIFVKRRYKIDENYRPCVSILIAAYNEEKVIKDKIVNLSQLEYPTDKIEFIIASDGSSDRTVEIAKKYNYIKNLRVLELPRGGKVNALNKMLKEVKGEVLVFSDANTMYDSNSIRELVKHFTDNRIGCVSGQLRYKIDKSSGHGAKSEGSYWKYENWVKVLESKVGRLSGANGAIYAVRKDLIKEIRKGVINDDFYIATNVLKSGYDVILETEAIAYEEPNDDLFSQFRRHVRDGAGHYQAIGMFWKMFFPRKGSFVYVSHRVIRWLVPFFLIIAFISNAALVGDSAFSTVLFVCQVVGYIGMWFYYIASKKGYHNKLINIVFYFFSINLSLLFGFLRLIKKQQKATWETQR